jgi:hypothetical protein
MMRNTPKWRHIEFADVPGGMATNPADPGQKFARRILNLHNHQKPGALKIRRGYDLIYPKPISPYLDYTGKDTITDMGFLGLDFFYDRQADVNGKQITCEIQRTRIHGIADLEETFDMLSFWIRPYWDGSAWIDEWQWLNQTFISKIEIKDSLYPNAIIIAGHDSNGIEVDSLQKFTIYNKTKGEYGKIITNKPFSTGLIRVCHTFYNNSWDVDDVLIIGRNWISPVYQNELYNSDWKDLAYHKILNDLRIGFGGYENRPGISIGYRKNFYQLRSFDFPTKHPDITAEGVLENFSKIDEVVLDTHVLSNSIYSLNLTSISGGELEAGEYTIRLTGIIDLFEEQLLTEDTILVEDNSTIEILPFVNIGLINPRITGFGIYYSTDGLTFYKIFKYNLKETDYAAGNWKIDSNGRIILIKALESTEIEVLELHTEENAASTADINSQGSWDIFNGGDLSVVTDAHDNYALKYVPDVLTTPDSIKRAGVIFPLSSITKGKYYSVSAYLKSSSINKLYALFLGESLKVLDRTQTEIIITDEYAKKDFTIYADNLTESPSYLAIGLNPGRNIFLSTVGGVVYRSADGLSWLSTSSGLPIPDPITSYSIINLGTSVLAAAYWVGSAVYRSTNSGASWTEVSGSNNITVLSVVNEYVFAGCFDGQILRSDNDGETFTPVNDSDISDIVIAIKNIGSNIFAGTSEDGVFLSTDNGVNWTAVNTGLTDLQVITLYANETYLFAGTSEGGVFRTANNGALWTDVNTGLDGLYIYKIVEHDGYLFVATYDNDSEERTGIYRSADNGDTWIEANTGLSTIDVVDLFVFGNDILAGTSVGKMFRSTDNGSTWAELTSPFSTFTYFQDGERQPEFFVDLVSIKERNTTVFSGLAEASTEMKAELGYNPTLNVVRGWDQALSYGGRTRYLNPYVDKRYENYILVSHIHSSGAYMYDVASFSNSRELEKFDSNKTIGMALLLTMDLLILKDGSYTILSDDGLSGVLREPTFGVDCISRTSIVNANGIVRWCGGEDIFNFSLSKGYYAEPLLKDTIRDIYIALPDKESLLGVRDKYNSYRLRVYDPLLKTEYLLSENGWIEEKRYHFAEIYKVGFRNRLYFLSFGNIYAEKEFLNYVSIEDLIMTGELAVESGV